MSGNVGRLCVGVAAGWIAAHAAVHAQALPAGFGWFASLAGSCWEGLFPDGRTRHRQCDSTQFGRFLRGTAQLSADREGGVVTTFEGDSVFGWNAERGGIEYTIWGSDGSLRGLAARVEDDELVFPVPARDDPSRIAYRSVWKRVDADRFEVRRERPVDGGWRSDLVVNYRRVQP